MRSIWAIVCCVVAPSLGRALEIDFGYNPNRHNMFLSGFSSNPVRNGNILGMPGLDFSGVGWGGAGHEGKNVALITPQHFVLADHFRMPVGTVVNFLNRNGSIVSRTITGYHTTTFTAGSQSDLTVGVLSSAFTPADSLAVYPVVFSGDLGYYIGRNTVTVGRNVGGATEGALGGKVGMDTIDDVFGYNFGSSATNTVGFGWQSFANTPDVTRLVGGDSGSPSFLLYGGALTILGTNSGIDTGVNPQYNVATFLPFYINQINASIAGTGFQLTIIQVPEPSVVASILTAAAGASLLRRRRAAVSA